MVVLPPDMSASTLYICFISMCVLRLLRAVANRRFLVYIFTNQSAQFMLCVEDTGVVWVGHVS